MICRLIWGVILVLSITTADAAVRIKDIANLKGVRENQILGYGLVIGLKGTGDTLRNSPFTEQSLQSMLDNMGINIRGTSLRTRNVAAVLVTADLPPFIAGGSRMDVAISSMGDASSLLGGTLVMTQLRGADNEVYAVAQGAIAVGGYSIEGAAQTVSQGVATSGRIPNGALIEREVRGNFSEMESLVLELKNPDYVTATRIIDSINLHGRERYQAKIAFERDYRSIVDLTVSAWAAARERFRLANASLASRSSIVAAAARRALAKLGLPVGRAGDAVVLSAFMPAGGDSGDDAALSVVASTMAVFLRGPEQACLDR